MRIIALVDDLCPKGGFRGEHGLSYYIETGSAKLLFDAGQTDALVANSETLGVDLAGVDAVALSHGHYDHGGGLGPLFASIAPTRPVVYAGRGYSVRKWARNDDGLRDIGLPESSYPPLGPAAVEVDGLSNPFPGVFLQAGADRPDSEAANPRFRLIDGGIERVDPFDDELSLILEAADGIVVVTGCAHRGIVNIVKAAMGAFPGRSLSAIVGGFHLGGEPDETLSRVAGELAALAPKRILCGHCTGVRGYAAIREAFSGVEWLSCGMRVEL